MAIAIVPIRSGSKGLKNKNILPLNGRPLVFWTIDALIQSNLISIENIFVSTDSLKYLSIIKKEYPNIGTHLRKPELACDDSSTGEVLQEFLPKFPQDEDFILCQATSPLRKAIQIVEAYGMYTSLQTDSNVVSVVKASEPEDLYTRMTKKNHLPDIVGIDKEYNRQKKDEKFIPNGAIYISKVARYLSEKSFFTNKTVGYVMNKKTSVDIDDEVDFRVAEELIKK